MIQTLFIFCVAGFTGIIAYLITRKFTGDDDGGLRDRLGTIGSARRANPLVLIKELFQSAARPFMPKSRQEQSRLRKQLAFAGHYAPAATRVLVGLKVICMAAGVLMGYMIGLFGFDSAFLGAAVGGVFGNLLPMFGLRFLIKKNRNEIRLSMADALDLMVVCVEAGLTIDSAMQRVGQELSLAHPSLAREMGITHMETRVGLSRAEAMKNLGSRTGVPELQSLASMLVQAERFGTSIGTALRVHADSLRTHRQHSAEAMASKASVKMSFPLVVCIFPATFIVLAGPTVVELLKSALFN